MDAITFIVFQSQNIDTIQSLVKLMFVDRKRDIEILRSENQ